MSQVFEQNDVKFLREDVETGGTEDQKMLMGLLTAKMVELTGDEIYNQIKELVPFSTLVHATMLDAGLQLEKMKQERNPAHAVLLIYYKIVEKSCYQSKPIHALRMYRNV